MTPGVRLALTAATVLGQASLIACGLDFDRFEPTDAGSETSTTQPPPATGRDASTPPPSGPDGTKVPLDGAAAGDASADVSMAPADVAADRAPALDASCTPPASCFTRAQTCNTQCSDQRMQCLNNCGNAGCMRRCDATEQNCTSQCATQCSLCSLLGGCAAQNDCLGAAGGG